MHRAGQFLVDPGDFLGWFNGLGIVAVGVMLFTLYKLRANYLVRLSPGVTPGMFGVGLGIGGALGIVSTLVLTTTSVMLFGTVVEITELDVSHERARAAGIDRVLVHGAASRLRAPPKNKAVQGAIVVAVVVGILLLVVGAGYAFTAMKLGFWGHFATMSAGIGLPEELAKAGAGLLILYMVFDTESLSPVQFRRAVLAAFAIAGLGFGAGEALEYFGTYARDGAGPFWYGVRGVWCVSLHGAWTLVVGAILTTFLPQDPKTLENRKAETFYALLLVSIPTAILHGLYDACCAHGEVLPWVFGGLSLLVAFGVVEAFLEEKQEEPKPGPQLPSEVTAVQQEVSSVISDQWYYAKDRKKCGPIPFEQLRQMAASGNVSPRENQILPTDMLLQVGAQKWVRADSVNGLFPNEASSPGAIASTPVAGVNL